MTGCYTGSGEHKTLKDFSSEKLYFNYLRNPRQVHQADISFKDRQWMRNFAKENSIDQEGLCYCQRPYEIRKTNNGIYIGLKYKSCKYRLCSFFRWNDIKKFQLIKDKQR